MISKLVNLFTQATANFKGNSATLSILPYQRLYFYAWPENPSFVIAFYFD